MSATSPNTATVKPLKLRHWSGLINLLLLRLITLLPQPWQFSLGRSLGRFLYRKIRRRRLVVQRNLALCFPELDQPQREQMAVRIFENNVIGFFETGMAWWANPRRYRNRVTIEGLEHIQAAQARGQGVLLVGAHYSSLDLGGFLLGQALTFSTLYRPHDNPLINYFLERGRRRFVKRLIPNSNAREVIKALRSGEVVWFAPDQDMGTRQSIFVRFFGQTAATVTASHGFARLGKAEVMIFGQYRNADGSGYRLTISPALADFPSSDEAVDTQRINDELEAAIRVEPEQYMWVHRRFKTQPDGRGELYQ